MGTEFNNGFGTNNMWNSYEQKNRMSYTGVSSGNHMVCSYVLG